MQIGVVTIDLQYDFLDPAESRVATLEKAFCLPGVRSILEAARTAGWPVIHVRTEHSGAESMPPYLRGKGVRPFCMAGTSGAQLIEGLASAHEVVLVKRSFSAFLGTALETATAACDTLVLCGVASDCCLLHTAFDAVTRYGKVVFVPLDACSSSTTSGHASAIECIAKSIGPVLRSKQIASVPAVEWASVACPTPSEARADAERWHSECERRIHHSRTGSGAPRLLGESVREVESLLMD